MKKLSFLAIIGLLVALATSCIRTNEPFCINCTSEGIQKQTYVVDTTQEGATITIFPVITPRNYDFCDSFVYYKGAYTEPYRVYPNLLLCEKEAAVDTAQRYREKGDVSQQPCVCRVNPDKKFNDTVPKNEFLYIEGIEKFPNSVMNIRTPGDTTKIRTYYNYNNKGDVFNGLILRTENTPIIESKMLKSGIYDAELFFFKDAAQQVPIGDTIWFKFAIIRSDKIANINCLKQARDLNDTKLLK
ncbi:MAG: hypothetical protein LBM68_03310 [Bacteroidales bacterium]|jgi:hypothetical protein|nr:hypothetical protein [Bacteroidales bacterium]